MKYYLESKTVNDKMQKDAKGSTQKFVSLGYLRAFLIDVPLELEQMEIVHILDNLLAEEQQAKETAEIVLNQIDLMKNPFSPVLFAVNWVRMTQARRARWNC